MDCRTVLVALATALPLAGCERPAPAPTSALPLAAAEPTATATSTASALPASAAAPGAGSILRAASAVALSARIPLAPGAEVVVDPRATFELELAARAPDARLVLLDAREDFVAASSTRELGPSTRLTLAPAAPLVPGSRYALRLDGATTRALHDVTGQGYDPLTFPLLAAGAPPPPEAKRPARKKRHR